MSEWDLFPVWYFVSVATVFGAGTGLFLNMVVWRVPNGMSIVRARNACPKCGAGIAWYDNIPIVSWVVLRAKCRNCGEPISARYPMVEGGTAVAFGLLTWLAFEGVFPIAVLPACIVFAAYSIVLALIDIQHQILPDTIVLPSYMVMAVLLALASWGTGDWQAWLHGLIGGAALLVFFFAVVLIYPAGMGLGDLKLAGVTGMLLGWFGWTHLISGMFAAFLIGSVIGVLMIAVHRADRKTPIPFGPFMLVGTWIGVLWGAQLGQWYLHISGIA